MLKFLSHNPYRATMHIDVGKKVYALKLDFERLVALEAFLGTSVLVLAQKVNEKQASFYELTAILYAGLSDKDKARLSFDVLGQYLLRQGLAETLKIAAQFLAYGLRGAPQDFSLNGLLRWGLCFFSLTPQFFWRLTVPEFFSFLNLQEENHSAMSRQEFESMMQQFPDRSI